jgi:nicotinamide phosphoribosyltransferase
MANKIMVMSSTISYYNNTTATNAEIFLALKTEHRLDPRMRAYIDYVIATHKPASGPDPNNPILISDSYKYTQHNMMNDDEFVDGRRETLIQMFASVEPRKGARDSHVVVAGIQDLANKLASIRVTLKDLHDAIVFLAPHFSTPVHDGRYHFNPWAWLVIIYELEGKLPIKLSGLAEGTVVPVGIPIATIESTNPACAQIVSHLEPLILQSIWYPTTCATNALGYSKVIKSALKQTATEEVMNGWLPFALQCFALRGVTCMEAARVGCGAILYITMGSDTVPAISHVMGTVGNNSMIAYSVAAIEHNQAMMQGRAGEFKQVRRVLKAYPTGILSYVADTYCLRNFIHQITTGELRDAIMARDGTFVARPDSSLLNPDGSEMSPAETIAEILSIMETNLGDLITKNDKGFKCLPSRYKIIYGDGLNIPKITGVLDLMVQNGWCASNIVFGVGGNLAQRGVDRDSERFAMKSSEQTFLVEHESGDASIEVRDVCKETPGKESKKGRFHIALENGVPKCYRLGDAVVAELPNMLETFSVNGQKVKESDNIDTIRSRINTWRDVYDF